MMNKIMHARADIALLITRLIVGGIFITTGWMKISDMKMTLGFFHQMGIPTFLAYIASYGEFIGGILLVLGLWTLLVSAFLIIIMIVAFFETRSLGFQVSALPLAVLSGLVALYGNGAGKYAIKKPVTDPRSI